MADLPLHPVAVHLPLALAVVWPVACFVLWLAIRRDWLPARSWWLAVGLAALLAAGALTAVRTGEADHEIVDKVLDPELIHEHEEAGERVLWVAVAALLVSVGGVAPRAGLSEAARVASIVVALLVLAGAIQAGHLGGRLVYVHGAASAYTTPPAP